MKNILKAFLATVIAILSLSCEKQEQQGDVNIDSITISLDVDEVTLASASLRVRHNGGSEATWTYVVTSDLESDADALIDAKVAKEKELTGEILAYKGQNRSLVVTDLLPKEYYRFICKAVDSETGAMYGDAAELVFRTRRDPAVFELNENWGATRGERTQDNKTGMEYDNFYCTSSDENTYVILPLKTSDFSYYYANEIRPLFEDYIADFGYPVGDSKWAGVLESGNTTYTEQRLRSGDWILFMVGVDSDGELSGLYQKIDFTIDPEVATKEYERWLGKWMVSDKNGLDLFEINVLPSENNMWYYVAGWEGNNLYFDTYDSTLMIETYFDKSTGKMNFVSQYVNTMQSDYETIDFYFSGAFVYYDSNIVVDAMNHMLAESLFTDTVSFATARIEGLEVNIYGTNFLVRNICYFYYLNGSNPAAISLAVPEVPLNMKRLE